MPPMRQQRHQLFFPRFRQTIDKTVFYILVSESYKVRKRANAANTFSILTLCNYQYSINHYASYICSM